MSKKANPTTIGLFIVVGLGLGIAGVLLFSSSRLFTRTVRCVLYFDSSLNGLGEGAAVKYRGVTIGSVERVMIHYNQSADDTAMPVLIDIREDLVRERWGELSSFERFKDVDAQVQRGLRATLETESLLTGILYISLEFFAEAPPPHFHQIERLHPEIPTRPTDIQQLLRNLARLDVAGLIDRLNELIGRVESSLDGLKLGEISEGVTGLIDSLDQVVTSPALTNSLASIHTTLEQYRRLADTLQSRVDPLADNLTQTLAGADRALAEVQIGVQNLGNLLAPGSALRHDLTIALEQLANAAQSISALAEFLETHPNALITGRRAQSKQP